MKFFKNLKYIKIIDELKIKFKDFSDNEILIEDIYNLALPHKSLIFDYFKEYLSFVYDYEKGQITEKQDFGKFLKDTLFQNELDVLEFGTWNGLGSTKIIFENSRHSDSVEINPFIYGVAKKNLIPINFKNSITYSKKREIFI